jgi:hypothetical protein
MAPIIKLTKKTKTCFGQRNVKRLGYWSNKSILKY